MKFRINSNKILVVGLVFLSVFLWVSINESRLGIPKMLKYVLSFSALIILIFYLIKNRRKPVVGKMYLPVLGIFVLWSVFLLVASILRFDNLFYIQRVFGTYLFFLPYLIPLIIIYSKFEIEFFKQLIKLNAVLLIPAILIELYIALFARNQTQWVMQTSTIRLFDLSLSFIFLISHLVKKKYITYLLVLYFVIWLFLYMFFGRRGPVIQTILLFLYVLYLRLGSSNYTKIYRARLLIVLISMMFLIAPAVINSYRSSYAFERGFNKDAFWESRGSVFEDFFYDLNRNGGWIFGRGLDGTVYRSIATDTERLDIIENGYLTLILKGGLVYLIPYVILLLRAAYLGVYKSNNDLCKALGFIAFNQVIMMAYHEIPTFSAGYILVWAAVSVSFTPRLRKYTNDEVLAVIEN